MTSFPAFLLTISRPAKRLMALLVDGTLCLLTVWLALYLRLEEWGTLQGSRWWAVAAAVLIALPLFVHFGLYRAIFRYTGWNAMLRLMQAMAVYALVYGVIFSWIRVDGVPRTVGIIQPVLLFVGVGLSRLTVRYWLGGVYRFSLHQQNLPGVLVYGAGSAGRQLAAGLARGGEYRLIGYVDDDERLHGNSLDGRMIYNPNDLAELIPDLDVTDVLLAVPSATHARRIEILSALRDFPVHVRTLPGMADLASGKVNLSDVRELDIEDLLGRPPVAPDLHLLCRNIRNKVVLITGAGGSIGSELSRQIAQHNPQKLILLENSEYALYKIKQDISATLVDNTAPPEVLAILGDVRDLQCMRQIVQHLRPDTIYHAAAYKHVPIVEHNVVQGLGNNVFGTLTVARVALEESVPHFVLISTDKAVRPTNLMGASKRLAEMVLQALSAAQGIDFARLDAARATAVPTPFIANPHRTCFTMVRFGNVLGSSGSVVPLFRQQIAQGGPITLTHEEVTRYFMTIPEAAQLVLQAGAMAHGGEVFVLDMGEAVKIIDLARHMVVLSGKTIRDASNPQGDIALEVTGLRPGEKLYEELLIGDNPQSTEHPCIMMAQEAFVPWSQLQQHLAELQVLMQANDIESIDELLQRLVSGFSAGKVVDHIAQQKSMQMEKRSF